MPYGGEVLSRLCRFGDSDALVSDTEKYSYAELTALVRDWTVHCDRSRIGPGQVVAVDTTRVAHACAALLALAARGAIAVPMTDPPAAKRAGYLDAAQVEVVVGVNGADRLTADHTGRTADHELYARLRHDRTPGLVLFSSGTAGRSKASVLDLGRMLDRYGEPRRARRTFGFLNVDHIGGINTLLHTVSHGGTIVAAADRTPDAVFAAIAEHRVQVLPTTPTFLTMMLISGVHERYSAASLELITYGTEPMPAPTLRGLRAAFPRVRLKQTYGLSEVGIPPTRSRADGSLWFAIGGAGFAHKVVDGVLWVRSDTAMLGYLNAPFQFDDDGYFNTQDAVETDGEYLRVLGRRSEIINVGGEKVYPSEVESVLLEIPNVTGATVRGRSSPVTGMVVTATLWLAAPEDDRALGRRVRSYCAGRLAPYQVPALIEVSTAPQHSERFKKIRT